MVPFVSPSAPASAWASALPSASALPYAPASPTAHRPAKAVTHRTPAPARGQDASRAPIAREDLFSLRARRKFAAYLRMRLLEMRGEGLERAADAVERSTPVEELLAPRR